MAQYFSSHVEQILEHSLSDGELPMRIWRREETWTLWTPGKFASCVLFQCLFHSPLFLFGQGLVLHSRVALNSILLLCLPKHWCWGHRPVPRCSQCLLGTPCSYAHYVPPCPPCPPCPYAHHVLWTLKLTILPGRERYSCLQKKEIQQGQRKWNRRTSLLSFFFFQVACVFHFAGVNPNEPLVLPRQGEPHQPLPLGWPFRWLSVSTCVTLGKPEILLLIAASLQYAHFLGFALFLLFLSCVGVRIGVCVWVRLGHVLYLQIFPHPC